MASMMNGMALHGGFYTLWWHIFGIHRLLPSSSSAFQPRDEAARDLCDDA